MTAIDPQDDGATILADLDAERHLLGALLADNGLMERLAVPHGAFYDPNHAELWKAARAIIHRGEGVSVAVLASAFPQLKGYIARLPDMAARSLLAKEHARTVREFAARRAVVRIAMALQEKAGDTSISAEQIMADASADLAKIPSSREPLTKRQVAETVLEELRRPRAIYPTRLSKLDEAMGGGLISGKLYAIGARKKVGKTLLLSTVSHNLNHDGVPHLFIGLEMSSAEIEQRNIAREKKFNSIKFLTRDLPDIERRVADYASSMPDHALYEHAPGATLNDLGGMVGRARLKGIRGVILDYLQLVGGKSGKDTEEYHHRRVAQWLADTARQTGLWTLTAAQLNQDGGTRSGEGLNLACDQYYTLHREKDQPGAWLEMQESRYTLYQNVGSLEYPAIWLRKHGPHFSDEPPAFAEPEAPL